MRARVRPGGRRPRPARPGRSGPPPARRPLPRGCPRPRAAPRRPGRAGGSRSGRRLPRARPPRAAPRRRRPAASRRSRSAPPRPPPGERRTARRRVTRPIKPELTGAEAPSRSPCRPRAGRTRPWPSCRSRARRRGWPRPQRARGRARRPADPLRGAAHGALEHALARLGGGQRRIRPGGHGRGYTARADAAGTSRRAGRARPRRARAA